MSAYAPGAVRPPRAFWGRLSGSWAWGYLGGDGRPVWPGLVSSPWWVAWSGYLACVAYEGVDLCVCCVFPGKQVSLCITVWSQVP